MRSDLYTGNPVTITYYVEGNLFAERIRWRVPRVNDEIRFTVEGLRIVYKVGRVVWIEDEDRPRVSIDLEAVKP